MHAEHPQLPQIRFGTLIRAAEGLTQWRPMVLVFLTTLATALINAVSLWLMAQMGVVGVLLGLVGMLLAVVVLFSGISGAGAMLMDKARHSPIRSFGEATLFGLYCIPKFIGFFVLLLLVGLGFTLVAGLVYLLCKIPVLGALLAFVAHPVMVVVGAVLTVAIGCVISPLFAPAVWTGLSLKAALANVVGIARKRLLMVVALQLVLYVIVTIIGSLILMGLLPSAITLTAMGLGIGSGLGGIMSLQYGIDRLLDAGAVMGMLAGLAVLFAVVWALMAQVMIMGLNLVYLEAQDGLDTSDTEQGINSLVGDMRLRAQQAAQRTKEAALRAKEAAELQAKAMADAQEARRAAAAQAKAAAAAQTWAEPTTAQPQPDSGAPGATPANTPSTATMEAAPDTDPAPTTAPVPATDPASPQDTRPPHAVAPVSPTPSAPVWEKLECPSCHQPVGADDVFCGECGQRLQP